MCVVMVRLLAVSQCLVVMTLYFLQVSATAAPAASRGETGSPTFQYIAQESLGFPAPRYGNGTAASPEDFDMTWPDGSTPPHYSNTVV